jgi:exodeoxyribonuclease VII small subunit
MGKQKNSFEEKLEKLDEIVALLDDGAEPLEDLLSKYEEGMKLVNELREFLNKAEMKIVEITKETENEG